LVQNQQKNDKILYLIYFISGNFERDREVPRLYVEDKHYAP